MRKSVGLGGSGRGGGGKHLSEVIVDGEDDGVVTEDTLNEKATKVGVGTKPRTTTINDERVEAVQTNLFVTCRALEKLLMRRERVKADSTVPRDCRGVSIPILLYKTMKLTRVAGEVTEVERVRGGRHGA